MTSTATGSATRTPSASSNCGSPSSGTSSDGWMTPAAVLDVACDRGYFIRNCRARERWATDIRDVGAELDAGITFVRADGLTMLGSSATRLLRRRLHEQLPGAPAVGRRCRRSNCAKQQSCSSPAGASSSCNPTSASSGRPTGTTSTIASHSPTEASRRRPASRASRSRCCDPVPAVLDEVGVAAAPGARPSVPCGAAAVAGARQADVAGRTDPNCLSSCCRRRRGVRTSHPEFELVERYAAHAKTPPAAIQAATTGLPPSGRPGAGASAHHIGVANLLWRQA